MIHAKPNPSIIKNSDGEYWTLRDVDYLDLVYDKTYTYSWLKKQRRPQELIKMFFDTLGAKKRYPYHEYEKGVITAIINSLTEKICYDLIYNNIVFHLPNGIGYLVVAHESNKKVTRLIGFKKRISLHFVHQGLSLKYLKQYKRAMFNLYWQGRLGSEIVNGHYYENIDDIKLKIKGRYYGK